MNNHDPIDLCECYEPLDFPSKEILREWKLGNKPKREPYYGTEPDGEMSFTSAISALRFRSILIKTASH